MMLEFSIEEIRLFAGGRWHGEPRAGTTAVGTLCTDTRRMVAGDVYLALRGERFDGADFLAAAQQAGASALITSRIPAGFSPTVPTIVVDDTLLALGRLARAHRERQRACVVGITGSNGKTTTRELVSSVLGVRYEVLQNAANENNRVGVPQTLLRLNERHDFAVIEMGTSEPGEIAALAGMTRPRCAILTAVSESHLQGLGSIEGVLREKSDLLAALERDGIAIVNFDDPRCVRAAERANCRVIGYGTDPRCEIRADNIRVNRHGTHFRLNGKHEFRLSLHGIHNVNNALAAIAVGWTSGIDVPDMQLALRRARPVGRRLEYHDVGGIDLLDDSYNANPASTIAALRTLREFPCRGQRIAVLGDMLELGEQTETLHRNVARVAAELGLDLVLATGNHMAALADVLEARFHHAGRGTVWRCRDSAEAARALVDEARAGDVVLVKGSNGMGMKAVVEALRALHEPPRPSTANTVREHPVGDPLPDTIIARTIAA